MTVLTAGTTIDSIKNSLVPFAVRRGPRKLCQLAGVDACEYTG